MSEQDNADMVLANGQLCLLPEPDLQAREYAQGIYSGDGLKTSDPARYEVIIRLLADGALSQRQIAKLTGSSRNLISGIARSQHDDIEPVKKRMANRARNLGELCLERIEEMLINGDKISAKDLGVIFGIATEKSQLLSGAATSRPEPVASDPGHDAFRRELEQMRRADVVEESPAMGFGGEKDGPKRDGLPAAGAGDGLQVTDDTAKPSDGSQGDSGGQNDA